MYITASSVESDESFVCARDERAGDHDQTNARSASHDALQSTVCGRPSEQWHRTVGSQVVGKLLGSTLKSGVAGT
jgi:hypothetical protein